MTGWQLLDVLDEHEGWLFIDGGEAWSVEAWIREWTAGALDGDRGPRVAVLVERDGRRTVLALDESGRPQERLGVLSFGF